MSVSDGRRAFWLETEFWIACGLVLLGLLPRLALSPLRGEEPRRAQVSFELIDRADWIVPREQGRPFESRPPFQNWLIALSTLAFNDRGPVPLRVPSVIAVVLTVVLLYGYSRQYLSRLGALTAAIAYPLAAEMFQTSRQAETEAIFAFLVGGSLLLWHWGYERGWNRYVTWILPYLLCGAAVLTKGGLQPPVYLLGAIGGYLLWKRRIRDAFTLPHLVGAISGAVACGWWFFASAAKVGWRTTKQIWSADTTSRFRDWELGEFANHLLVFPWEVVGGILPWSTALFLYASPQFRRGLGSIRPAVVFSAIATGLAFLTIWLPPGGKSRFLAPLYPCIAVLCAAVYDRAAHGNWTGSLARIFRVGIVGFGVLSMTLAIVLPLGPFLGEWKPMLRPLVPPMQNLVLYSIACGLVGMVLMLRRPLLKQTIALGALIIILCGGLQVDLRVRRTVDTEVEVAKIRELVEDRPVPASFGAVDALFAYHFKRPIPLIEEQAVAEAIHPGDWFFFQLVEGLGDPVPFPWTELGRVSVTRFADTRPGRWVVLARRQTTPQIAGVSE